MHASKTFDFTIFDRFCYFRQVFKKKSFDLFEGVDEEALNCTSWYATVDEVEEDDQEDADEDPGAFRGPDGRRLAE